MVGLHSLFTIVLTPVMSGLLALCNYSSESDEDCGINNKRKKTKKLPQPNLSQVSVVKCSENHTDNIKLHGGRIRSFPHERGNWASFIYITYPESDSSIKIINQILKLVSSIGIFKKCEDLHISLSKTVVLKYHWINSFVDAIQSSINNIDSFELEFESVKVYCNEERTRTFISLEVKFYSRKYLQKLTEKIDKVLEEYKLSTFYEDPSYHMSVLWIEGDKEKDINNLIKDSVLTGHCNNHSQELIVVDKVSCKIGNRFYQFLLKN